MLNINLETLSDTNFILYIIKVLDKNAFELTSEPLGEEKMRYVNQDLIL